MELGLRRALERGETVGVSYVPGAAGGRLWGTDGNQFAAFSGVRVTNGPAAPAVSVVDVSAAEGGTLAFAVQLDAGSDAEITVADATADGTAAVDADYEAVSGTLVFAAGELKHMVEVATIGDLEEEDDENAQARALRPAGSDRSATARAPAP